MTFDGIWYGTTEIYYSVTETVNGLSPRTSNVGVITLVVDPPLCPKAAFDLVMAPDNKTGSTWTFTSKTLAAEDGGAVTFSWEQTYYPTDSVATLSDYSGEVATLVPDLAGYYEIKLTVSDSHGQSTEKTMAYTAVAALVPPDVVTYSLNASNTVSTLITFFGVAKRGGVLSYVAYVQQQNNTWQGPYNLVDGRNSMYYAYWSGWSPGSYQIDYTVTETTPDGVSLTSLHARITVAVSAKPVLPLSFAINSALSVGSFVTLEPTFNSTGGAVTYSSSNINIAYFSTTTPTKFFIFATGNVTITMKQAETATYGVGVFSRTIQITGLLSPGLRFSFTGVSSVGIGDSIQANWTSSSPGSILPSVGNPAIVNISSNAGSVFITGVSAGTTTITVSQNATASYAAASVSLTVTVIKKSLRFTSVLGNVYQFTNDGTAAMTYNFINSSGIVVTQTGTTIIPKLTLSFTGCYTAGGGLSVTDTLGGSIFSPFGVGSGPAVCLATGWVTIWSSSCSVPNLDILHMDFLNNVDAAGFGTYTYGAYRITLGWDVTDALSHSFGVVETFMKGQGMASPYSTFNVQGWADYFDNLGVDYSFLHVIKVEHYVT